MALLAAAAGVRLLASLDQLWLDEILAWRLAGTVERAGDVFLRLHSEVNHHLLTLWIAALGPERAWPLYRLPSVVAGALTVVLAALIARRRGRTEAWVAALLVGGSYPLIHYSSEARGYALAVLFAYAAWLCALRLADAGRPLRWSAGFAASVVLGLLSHLSFLYAHAALAAWSLGRKVRGRSSAPWVALAVANGPPLAFLAWLALVDLRYLQNLGGPIVPASEVAAGALSLLAGGPESGGIAWILAAAVAAAAVAGLASLRRSAHAEGSFFLGVGLLWPAVLMLASGRREVYPRYFLIAGAFVLLLLARALAALWDAGGARRAGAALLLAAVLAGNAAHVARLLLLGRGAYREAIELMWSATAAGPVSVGSDHDFRTANVLAFYVPARSDPERLVYHGAGRWPAEGPEWYLVHDQSAGFRPALDVRPAPGLRYRLAGFFPYAGLSGWHWAVYRNERKRPKAGAEPR